MNIKVEILNKMQGIDDIIGEKQLLTEQLPSQLNTLQSNVQNTKQEMESTKHLLDTNLKEQKLKEIEIQNNKDKIAKYKNQLLTIKTNKEYKALNSEISHLEKKNSDIDDIRVELMVEEENLRNDLKENKQALEKANAELNANENKIRAQIEKVESEIEALKNERNQLAKQLPRSLIKRYASLIKHKNRKAVVFNEKGSCSGCGFKLRPQLIIEINNGEGIFNCENCGRILVYKIEK